MIRRFTDPLAARLRRAATRAASERRRVHGIEVWILNDGQFASTGALFQTVQAALGLVGHHTPWRLEAIRRDVARIFVLRMDGVRALLDGERVCRLDTFFVATFAPEQVASSLVHEGVHARLCRGGRRVPRDLIAWEERLCRRAEVGFGQRLPPGAAREAVLKRARAALALSDRGVAPLAGDIQLRPRRPRGDDRRV